MIKATILYTNCMQDKRNIYKTLSTFNCIFVKEQKGFSMYPKITVKILDHDSLKELMFRLNDKSTFGASLIKWKEY